MNRGASAAIQAEWAKVQNAPAHLLEVAFDTADGGSVYLNDGYRSIVWGGHTYTGLGTLLNFSGLTESMELRVADITVELSGVDQTAIALFLSRQYVDRRLVLYQCFFDGSDALIVDPFAIHDGRMDEPRIIEDPDIGKCTVSVTSRDQFSDFERLAGRHTNMNDQRTFFSTDACFDQFGNASFLARNLVWGNIKEPSDGGIVGMFNRLGNTFSKMFG